MRHEGVSGSLVAGNDPRLLEETAGVALRQCRDEFPPHGRGRAWVGAFLIDVVHMQDYFGRRRDARDATAQGLFEFGLPEPNATHDRRLARQTQHKPITFADLETVDPNVPGTRLLHDLCDRGFHCRCLRTCLLHDCSTVPKKTVWS